MPVETLLQSPSGCTPRRGLPAALPRGPLPRATHHPLGLSSGPVSRWGGLAPPGACPLAAVPDPRASTQVTAVETATVSASVGVGRPTHGTYSSDSDSGMETDSGSATAKASVRLLLVVGVVLLDDPEWRRANEAPGYGNGNGYSSRTLSTSPGQQQQQPVRVLLAQRPADKSYSGLWEFPGGKVDPGETPEAAAVRELREELGIMVDPCELKPLSFASHTYPTFHLLMPLYVCRRWKGEPRGAEGQAVVWVTGDQINSYNLTPADIPLVPAVLAAMRHAPPPPAQSPVGM